MAARHSLDVPVLEADEGCVLDVRGEGTSGSLGPGVPDPHRLVNS